MPSIKVFGMPNPEQREPIRMALGFRLPEELAKLVVINWVNSEPETLDRKSAKYCEIHASQEVTYKDVMLVKDILVTFMDVEVYFDGKMSFHERC